MKKTIIVMMMALISLSVFGFDIPGRPNPPKLVNDYIELLQPDQVQALEAKLVAFDNETSIQIAIVILDDLDREEAANIAVEIGEEWGVGQKELDNGIVFLVVRYSQNAIEKLFNSKRGDVYIATGYGLEPYLTDAQAGSLLDKYFIPNVKKDKYFEAIDETVIAMVDELGEIGWQQREELEAKRKAEAAEAMRKFGNGLLMFLIFGSIAGLIIWLIVKARKAYQKAQEIKQRKESLKKTFYEAKSEFEKLFSRIPTETSSYPSWAIELHEKIVNNIERASKAPADDVIKEFPVIVESNMPRASQILSILTGCVFGLKKSIAELEAIPEEIKKYLIEAPEKLNDAKEAWNLINQSIRSYKAKGFNLLDYENLLKSFKTNLDDLDDIWSKDKNKAKNIALLSDQVYEQINSTMQSINSYLSNREATSKIIANLNSKIQSLPAKKESAQKVLDQIKAENPKQNWEDLENAFGSVTPLLGLCQTKKEEAEKKNSMEVQDFNTAKSLAVEANEKLQKILNIFHDIHSRKDDIANAKANYDSSLKAAETAIASAEKKCLDSDVEESSKEKLVEAQTTFDTAKTTVSENIINWLLVIVLLNSAKTLANESLTMAQSDIDKAEEARKAAAAAVIAAAAAAAKKRSQKSSYSHSSSSSSGRGFGGFGGGGFGGGGAGRSW